MQSVNDASNGWSLARLILLAFDFFVCFKLRALYNFD